MIHVHNTRPKVPPDVLVEELELPSTKKAVQELLNAVVAGPCFGKLKKSKKRRRGKK